MTTAPQTSPEPIEDVEARLGALGLATVFDDHGLTWSRKAGKEWARLASHTIMVLPALEPTHDAPWSWFFVADDDTATILASGTAPTRPHARQAAVLALGDLLSPPAAIDPGPMAPGPALWMRRGAVVVLGLMALAFVAATVAGLVSVMGD